jgi:hypothetical protein
MTLKSGYPQFQVAPDRSFMDNRKRSMSGVLRRALVTCLLVLSSFSAAAESVLVRPLERMILGSWRESVVMGEATSSGISVYSPDSTVTHQIKFVGPGLTIEVRTRSRWRIEGKELITEVTESSRPDVLPIGTTERDTIVAMEKNQWVYRDSDGVEVTAIRLKVNEQSGD